MAREPDRETFAEMVREVRAQPVTREPRRGDVTDPEGTRWFPSTSSISEGQAHALVEGGARLAWDACGCGGYCGFRWFGPDETERLVAARTPTVRNTKRRRGNISRWTSDDGRVLVVAEVEVRWADLMAQDAAPRTPTSWAARARLGRPGQPCRCSRVTWTRSSVYSSNSAAARTAVRSTCSASARAGAGRPSRRANRAPRASPWPDPFAP